MNYTIDSLHYKISAKFEHLFTLISYVKHIFDSFKNSLTGAKDEISKKTINFSDYINPKNDTYLYHSISKELDIIDSQLNDQYCQYNNLTSSLLLEHYETTQKTKAKEIFDSYQKVITSRN